MKVLYVGVPEAPSAEWERCLSALRMAGIEPQAVADSSALEGLLTSDECGGWLHIVSASGESAQGVVELAARHPERLTIVAGFGGGVARDFASSLPASEAELLVVLEEFEDAGSEIRSAVARWLTRRWVNTVLRPVMEPQFANLAADDLRLVQWVYRDSPIGGRGKSKRKLSGDDVKRLTVLLTRAGFRTEKAIRSALQLLCYCTAASCAGLTSKHGVRVCGLTDKRDISSRASKVLGVGDLEKVHKLGVDEVARRVLAYICVDRNPGVVTGTVLESNSAVSRWLGTPGGVESALQSSPQVGKSGGSAVARAGNDEFWRALVAGIDGFLTAHVRNHLADPEDIEDVKQEVWEKAFKRLAEGRVPGVTLTIDGVEEHRVRWKGFLAGICQGVLANFNRRHARWAETYTDAEGDSDQESSSHSQVDQPDRVLERTEVLELIAIEISALSGSEERKVAELRILGGYTTEETALKMGVSERTVERRLQEARRQLSESLGESLRDYLDF